jgi:hypothetical protein
MPLDRHATALHRHWQAQPERKDVPVSPFPGHASCVQCHNFALMLFTKPGYCGICHEQNALSTSQPMLFRQFQTPRARSDFGSDFSHVAHRKTLPAGLTLVPSINVQARWHSAT